jgi:hypothetical protein
MWPPPTECCRLAWLAVGGAGYRAPVRLLDRDDVDWRDRRLGGEQIVGGLVERFRYATLDVRLPSLLRGESVEDPVMGVVDPERVPGHGLIFGDRKFTAGPKELGEIFAFPSLASSVARNASVTPMIRPF